MTPERIEEIKEFLEKFGQLPGHMVLELLAALEEAQQQNEFLEISISAAIDHWEDTEKLLAEAQQTIARQREAFEKAKIELQKYMDGMYYKGFVAALKYFGDPCTDRDVEGDTQS